MSVYERGQPSSRTGFVRHAFGIWFAIGTLIALSACGGGGGGGGGGNPAPANPSPPPTPPPAFIVVAGEDQTIELPDNEAALSGSATGGSGTLTYSWTAAPAVGVSFADATAATTTVTFTEAGTYTLTLSATAGSASGSDAVQIVVNPAMYPAADTDADANHGWTPATPAEVGLDEAKLAAARDFALTGGGAGAVVRKGRLAYVWGDIDARADVKSTTKSIGGIALGLAYDENLVELETTARTYLSTLGNPPVENEATGWPQTITVLQLATHTAGFEKVGGYGALVKQPGTVWLYSDGGLNWLADMLTQVYAQDLSALLTARVWSVLGITADDIRWRANSFRPGPYPDGIERRELASGMDVNANAMARVGLLFLREGMWAGGQRLVSKEFVDIVRTPRPEIAGLPIDAPADFPNATANYGVLWWTNAAGTLPNVPTDAYWAWGLGDSLIVVIPSLDLVIGRTGNDTDNTALPQWRSGWNGDYSILANFLNPIVDSVQD
jgi:CubicO group peptidase (beta-lactamase class C family)